MLGPDIIWNARHPAPTLHCRTSSRTNPIKEYLNICKELINYKNGYFFKIVADKGNLELIKLFVENGENINNYVLYTCAYNNHIDCFNYLISIGANIETIKNTCGYNKAKKILQIYTNDLKN